MPACGCGLTPRLTSRRSSPAGRSTRGAVGICCAKIGEAEVFADAGVRDIRLPYPVNPSNAARLLALMDRAAISIIVDHPRRRARLVRGDEARRAHARRADQGRRRVSPLRHRSATGDALGFIQTVASLPGLQTARPAQPRRARLSCGVGRRAARDREGGSRDARRPARHAPAQSGIALDEISVGATPTLRFSAGQPGVTELRPGNYVYFDRTQVALGAASLDDCALTVLATVVAKHPGRIILDCGSKTLTNDQARGITPVARLRRRPRRRIGRARPRREIDEALTIERLSEEHATVRVTGDDAARARRPRPRRARTIPASSRTWSTSCGSWKATRCSRRCRSRREGGSRRTAVSR